MNPFFYLSDPSHARLAFWVLVVSGVSYLVTLALLGLLVRLAARWLWRKARAVVGSWVSFLWFQWTTRPVRECRCCRRAEAEASARTRRQVFGPLHEFGPYRMPRRQPQHVPPQVLPSAPVSPWPDERMVPRNDGFGWSNEPGEGDEAAQFAEPADLVPLSWEAFVEQVQAEYDSGQWRGDTP